MAKVDLTAQRLRELLSYDPETGVFIWKISLAPRGPVGAVAGCVRKDGRYWVIRIEGRLYLAHRLAWLHVRGEWTPLVDHKSGDGLDNRFDNLRAGTKRSNGENQRKGYGRTGLLGVTAGRWGKNWRAQITINGKNVPLGTFDTPNEAHQAYLVAKRKWHEGCMI